MKVGDKKKATLLGVVAVGAILFLGIRMMPDRAPKVLRSLAGQPTAEQAASTHVVATLPMTLVNDPFSHPDLAAKKPGATAGPSDAAPTTPKSSGDQPADAGGVKPFGGDSLDAEAKGMTGPIGVVQIPSLDGTGQKAAPPAPDPGGAKTKATPAKAPPRAQIAVTLSAVMDTGHATAFIAIEKNDAKPFEIGEALPTVPPFRVVDIFEDRIVLKGAGKTTVLYVGHEAKL